MERPAPEEKFTAEIDRISGAGNGIIELDKGHVNVGQVTHDAVGEEVECLMLDKQTAQCLDAVYQEGGVDQGEIGGVQFCSRCHSMMKTDGKMWVCRKCGHKKFVGETTPKQIADDDSSKSADVTDDIGESLTPESTSSQVTEDDRPEASWKTTSDKLSALRDQAVANADDSIPGTAITTNETTQYHRSPQVKRYVEARAEGQCEGCGDPAPFTSKTGKPYLHVHHIYELSNGGSDTPETVVALCPNCHYRVHHGQDGDEYNQQLLQKVQRLEAD